MKQIIGLLVFALVLGACVPLKQFEELSERNGLVEDEIEMLRAENDALRVKSNEYKSELERSQKKVDALVADTLSLSKRLRRQQFQYEDLNKSYTELLKGVKSTGAGNGKNKELLVYLQKLQDDLLKREDALLKSEEELSNQKRELRAAIEELEASKAKMLSQNKRLQELETALSQKDEAMLALRKSVSDALMGFSSDELKVHMKNGKVYVSLEEKLLFSSGSYEVNAQGVSALKEIATVLEENKSINVIVEGHTDNVPYKSAVLKDNWDLSVKRATSVVRILLDNSSIDPVRISAAGKGEFLPLKKGSSANELRANRRTEIILTPKMDEVLNLLDI